MKKALFSTTALAAAGALAFGASDAVAQSKAKPMSISVGGFFNSYMGYAEQSGSFESTASATARVGYDQFNVINDSEIYFKGSTKLDNGMGVSVVVQLETDQTSNGTQIDESYMTLSGGFGSVILGSTKHASVKMNVDAPSVGGLALSTTDHNNWIIKPSSVGTSATGTTTGASDAMKVIYMSPTIAGGLSVGASVTPSTNAVDTMPAVGGNSGTDSQVYAGVVKYSGKMGGATVSANLAYDETHGAATASNSAIRTGVSVATGPITVGMSYRDVSSLETGIEGTANSPEKTNYMMGIKYTSGAYTIGAAYGHSEMPLASGTQGDDELDKYQLGAEYSMGAGVTLTGQFAYLDWSDELTSDANNNSGWALVGGVKVAF